MTSKQSVDGFLDQTVIAVAGVSRSGRGFGAMAYRALKSAGYKALAVNPNGGSIDGEPLHPSFAALPEPAGAVLVVTPPPRVGQGRPGRGGGWDPPDLAAAGRRIA